MALEERVVMAFIVQGLQFGDECKGATVDYLCSKHRIDLVVRFNGGFQAAHNVVMCDGSHHTFSQFGSGTLRGVKTYIGEHVIVDPLAFIQEGMHLRSLGINNAYDLVTVHEDCLISTIYHKRANRVIDQQNGHGSCGVGVGLTRKMWSDTGDGLRVSDLFDMKKLRRKLNWIRQWCQDQICFYDAKLRYAEDINLDWKRQVIRFEEELNLLWNSRLVLNPVEKCLRRQRVIFEGSQGAGLDEVYGTIPHTTYSNTKPTYALEMCREWDIQPHIYGLFRPYETRHGNGPMYKEEFGKDFVDLSKDHNWNNGSFAGNFRFGHLDVESVTRRATLCGANELVLSCADHAHIDYVKYLQSKFDNIRIISYGPTAEDRITL